MNTDTITSEPRLTRLCHDLRQYVAAGSLVSQGPAIEEMPAPARERFDTLSRIFRHISEMLAAELGHEEPRAVPVDLVGLVDECVRVLGVMDRLPVTTQVSRPAFGLVDPVLLRRAVSNVLDNAVRAAGSRGRVSIRIGSSGVQSYIEVADDGLGFGRIAAGHGQGMAVVGNAVGGCGGRLEIASGPGPGTTVRMIIPAPQRERDAR